MAKQNKSKSSSKKVSKKDGKKKTVTQVNLTAPVQESAPAPVPAPAPAPVEVKNVVNDDEPQVWEKHSETFTSLIAELQTWRSNITSMIATVRALQKSVEKEIKNSQKKSKKQSNKPKREPSGFAKPTEISHELCDFLQKPYGTEMARTEVTKYLTQYIKQFNLQEPSDKRKINPDLKLSKLLGCESTDEVTYFNLQKWMKPHFSSAQTSTQ